jgi:hypothetical protein
MVGDVVKKTGVRQLPLFEFIRRYAYIAVARYPGMKTNARRQSATIDFAQNAIASGVRYNSIGAILLPLKENFHLQRACSIVPLPPDAIGLPPS